MKTHTSISHFSGREQQALLGLKNKLVELYKPLFIYLIGCSSSSCLTRNCFNNPKNETEWSLSSDLLLILPEGAVVSGNHMEELKYMNKDYRKVRLIVHPINFFEKQLKDYSLFFCWIQHRAIVLYKKDTFNKNLLEPVQNMKQYEKQAESFFANNQYYKDYTKIKLSPLPKIGAWENLVEGALSSHEIGEEVGDAINVVKIYNWLLKLMEAAHLIWIRVVFRKLIAQKENKKDNDETQV